MTFGKPQYNKKYELIRCCSSNIVAGGAKKLFTHFVNQYSPTAIISYCDNSKFTGNVYRLLNFTELLTPTPSKHWYTMKTKKHLTDNFVRQHGADQLLCTNYGKGIKNDDILSDEGFVVVYDCGQSTFI